MLALQGDLTPVHDPTMVHEGPSYYVFATNKYQQKDVPGFCSSDLHTFRFCGNVFDGVPAWALAEIPGARGIRAPDVKFVHGEFRMYYAVSTFGSSLSDIGLIVNKTMDPKSPDYSWVDKGKVFGSVKTDDFNAIDPNLAIDADANTGKLSIPDSTLYSIASRPRTETQKGQIEALFVIRHGQYYYLFVSYDRCCRGAQSTYRMMVGRSDRITGPYVDKDGKPMMEGAATELLAGNERWRGPGGQSIVQDPDRDLLVFHAYDGKDGRPFLHISTLAWDNGWPRAEELPAQ